MYTRSIETEIRIFNPYRQCQEVITVDIQPSHAMIEGKTFRAMWTELRALGLMANEGLPQKLVAQRYGLATQTVKNSLCSLRKRNSREGYKMRANSQIAALAEINGMLDPKFLDLLSMNINGTQFPFQAHLAHPVRYW